MKKHSIGISVFGYENKVKYPIYISKKCCEEKNCYLLLIGEEGKRHYFLLNISIQSCMIIHYIVKENIFVVIVYNFSVQEKLECHINDYNDKKGEYVRFKNYEGKIKSPYMIYADLESTLLPEGSGKQNSEEPYRNKCQKHISCSYGYKLVCVYHKFSQPFRS